MTRSAVVMWVGLAVAIGGLALAVLGFSDRVSAGIAVALTGVVLLVAGARYRDDSEQPRS